MSLAIGQLDVLMAAAIVLGFRWPAAWLLPFITKLTPGIGVLWFAARREWRSLGIALGATAAVVGLSMTVGPAGVGRLDRDARPIRGADLGERRVPAGAALGPPAAGRGRSSSGAHGRDRRWVLPIGVTFALPTVWINTPTILVAILPLIAARRRHASRALAASDAAGRRPSRSSGSAAGSGWAGLVVRREVATMLASTGVAALQRVAPVSRR